MKPEPDGLTIYSSIRGLITAALAPTLLVLAGVAGLLRQPTIRPSLMVVFGLAAFLAFVAMWDYPRRCEFGPEGLVRVCLLRRQQLRWDDILVIRRTRGSVLTNLRSRDPHPSAYGGLTAKVGRRVYLLADHAESAMEHDRLVNGIARWAPDLPVSAARPSAKVPPTDLYRRHKAG